MIEGIVGLFVILLVALIFPYAKDWYRNTFHPEDIVKITVTQNGWTQTRRDGVVINHAYPAQTPIAGDLWFDRSNGQTYIWSGSQWEPKNPKEGDLWLW